MVKEPAQNQPQELPAEADPSKELPGLLDVVIINLDKVLLEKKAKSVILPVTFGSLAVLAGHTPMFTKLIKGEITVNEESGGTSKFEIENGIAKITQYKATVLLGF